MLEGTPSPWIRAWNCVVQHRLPPTHTLLPFSSGETEARSKARLQVGCARFQSIPEPRPPGLPLSSLPALLQAKTMLTLIQGWFMNCMMVSLSVGSVFRSRRISCLARGPRKEGSSELQALNPPHEPQALSDRAIRATFFMVRKGKLTIVSCLRSPSA